MNAEETVLAFVEAWNRLDQDRIYALMADDIVYHNMPLQPVTGRAAVRDHLDAWPVDECEWEVLHIAARGNVVLTERVDRFRRGDDRIVVPVMGTFEVADGRITRWRDYFDLRATKPLSRTA
jgi:limonene-1,2-epoxide hydrolase